MNIATGVKEILFVLAGDKVRSTRAHKGWTQEFLAEKAGISRTSLSNIEIGRQRLTLFTLAKIALALECEWMDLLPELSSAALLNAQSEEWRHVLNRAYEMIRSEHEQQKPID